ncbi:LPP20 family lipoprotein [Photobacterium kishitanii]|uniref:LPP20 family lipoprotein n=1 Tax=Photobacterium kishitanii TaxID=318456 RepID=UPI0011B295DA|nr:LPP20 family lipoprotein [Photobacterium kishitanii]
MNKSNMSIKQCRVNNRKQNNRIILNVCCLLLSIFMMGCQSTTRPDWYSNIAGNDIDYIYAVGDGRSLSSAKKSALSQINEQLWTQVSSSSAYIEQFKQVNENQFSHQSADNRINTQSAEMIFTGIEFLQSAQDDAGFFVQARIKRENIKNQLKADLGAIEVRAQMILQQKAHQDLLIWWLANRTVDHLFRQYQVKVGVLSALDVTLVNKMTYLPQLATEVEKVRSSLLIRIVSDHRDRISIGVLQKQLALDGIATIEQTKPQITHTIIMKSNYRQSIVGDAFITTKFTDLITNNKNGKTLSKNEIISNANSLTNYKVSKDGAERHFSERMVEMGIWQSLGFSNI